MKASLLYKETHNTQEKPENPLDSEFLIEQESYLSQQFRRVPFLLYKFWLILSIPIHLYFFGTLILNYQYINEPGFYLMTSAPAAANYLLFLYGCGQMLYAMNKKKSRIAQESYTKFQYYLIISAIRIINPILTHLQAQRILWLAFYLVFSPIIHLVGGFAVLRAFKKNHPIMRMNENKGVSESENKDFLQQNEAIASEFSKFDQQLNSCPYFIFNWFLKSAVVFGILYIFVYLVELDFLWENSKKITGVEPYMYFLSIGFGILCLLNAFSYFQMEVAMTTRSLEKAKRAIIWLKICIGFSIIECLFIGKWMDLNSVLKTSTAEFIWRLLSSVLLPILSLLGGLRVKKIIEERENFIKVSSYSQDLYL